MDGLTDEEWLHYSYVGHTATWKVVLLSLNINPKYAVIEKDPYALFWETTTKIIRLDRREYSGSVTNSQIQERYEIIENRKYEGKYFVGNFEVDIQRFVEFAEKINLRPFPEKLLNSFKKENNLFSNKVETTKPTKLNQNWSINRINDRVFYSQSLTAALEHFHSLGGLPPTASDVLHYLSDNQVESLVVDLKKNTLTYPTQKGHKVADSKNLTDAISRRINLHKNN